MVPLGVVAAETMSVLLMKCLLIVLYLRRRALHHCGGPVPSRTIGLTSVVFLSTLALNGSGGVANRALSLYLDKLSVCAPVIKAAIMRRGFICTSLIGVTSGTIRLATTGTFASRNVQRVLGIELQNVTSAKY